MENTQTHRQNKYCNPRACAPRVNNYIAFLLDQHSRGRDKPLEIAITDILRLTGEC